jgi:hypothetical protein
MSAFRDMALGHFPTELAEYIRKSHPEAIQGLTAAELRRRVDYGIKCAGTFEIRDANSLAGFVSLLFIVGPRFHQHPSIRAILDDPAVPAGRRLRRLNALSAWSWAAAQDTSEQAWQDALGTCP